MNVHLLASLIALCPVALASALPLSLFAAKGRIAGLKGTVLRLQKLRRLPLASLVVFDESVIKAGVQVSFTRYIEEQDAMSVAYTLASASPHGALRPLGDFLAAQESAQQMPVTQMEALSERGMRGRYDDAQFVLGALADMERDGVDVPADAAKAMVAENGSVVGFARNKRFLGYFTVITTMDPDVVTLVRFFRAAGVRTLMLTPAGKPGAAAAQALADDTAEGLSAQAKADLIVERRQRGDVVLAVSAADAVSPLASSDVVIAFGADASEHNVDILFPSSDLSAVIDVYKVSCTMLRIFRQNLVFAVVYTLIAAMLAVGGFIGPQFALVLLVCSTLLVALHALRVRFLKL